jgi:predicted XRE-type DNA-binding protein
MKFPSEKELKVVRKKLSKKQGSLVLSKDATPLEKLRYEICRQFVIYQREHELKSKELAKIVGVDTSIMSKVLKYRNERFSTDKLMEMLAKIYPKHDLLLKIAA